MERRASIEIRAEGNKLIGLASPTYNGEPGTQYELWEDTYERFAAGAFDRTLDNDVVALINHDPNLVLGRTPHTLKLTTDAKGLHYAIDLPDTQAARDLRTSIARGDIRGSSFSFTPIEIDWLHDNGKQIRLIRSATLHDVSVVTKPAYSSTSVHVRSEERKELELERDRLETEKRFLIWDAYIHSQPKC